MTGIGSTPFLPEHQCYIHHTQFTLCTFAKNSLSNKKSSTHTRNRLKHKQAALITRAGRQDSAAPSALGSALPYGTTAAAPAGAAGKRSLPGQAGGGAQAERGGQTGSPELEQRGAEEGGAAGPAGATGREGGGPTGPEEGKGRVTGPAEPRRGTAASHQQRHAEEAPSRQQLGDGRRHLRFRQQHHTRPHEASTFNGAGITSPWGPYLTTAGRAAECDVMCL